MPELKAVIRDPAKRPHGELDRKLGVYKDILNRPCK